MKLLLSYAILDQETSQNQNFWGQNVTHEKPCCRSWTQELALWCVWKKNLDITVRVT